MKTSLLFLFFLPLFLIKGQQDFTPKDKGSKVHFVIKNFGINTGGDLTGLKGVIKFDQNQLAQSSFDVSVSAHTVDTDNSMRDASLKKDYFQADKYPELRLVSTKINTTNKTAEGIYFFTGKLTIKGTTKDVSFPFKVVAQGNGYLFTGEFEINRLDYKVGESSSIMGNKVSVSLSVLAQKD